MGKVRIDKTILRGDRVGHADRFLEDTGQFTKTDRGPDAPCHWGHNARGTVKHRANGSAWVTVEWDDGVIRKHLAGNLKRVSDDG